MNRVPIELDTFHHIYNRGVDKRSVFIGDDDRALFLKFCFLLNDQEMISPCRLELEDMNKKRDPLVSIIAFCLMPNHFHFVLYEKTEGGISKFMQRLGTAYTMYFNEAYERSGALFEGRFKSKYIDDNAYLMGVIDYTHLNPITHKKNGEKALERRFIDLQNLDAYEWSSYSYYCGGGAYSNIIDTSPLLEYHEMPTDYRNWLKNEYDFGEIKHLMID